MDFLSPLVQNAFSHQLRFEPQLRAPQQRMCGAAALVMAYRQCGLSSDQQSIWNRVAEKAGEQYSARTFRMAADAIKCGLAASVIQSLRPFELLRQCWRNNIAVILNHRVESGSGEGHYSLLAGINQHEIRIHDPFVGPGISYSIEEFKALWLPLNEQSEIAGQVAIAIARKQEQPSIWSHCERPLPDHVDCVRCRFKVPVSPVFALGCWNPACRQRLWLRLFCPSCDHAITQI